jgi:hypothetical protein
MKRLLSATLLLSAIATAPAFAAPVDAACAASAQQLALKADEFIRISGDASKPAQRAYATPVDFHRTLNDRDSALQAIANDIWTLRIDMAGRNCAQAEAFAY